MTRRAPKRAVMAPANGPHTPWLYFVLARVPRLAATRPLFPRDKLSVCQLAKGHWRRETRTACARVSPSDGDQPTRRTPRTSSPVEAGGRTVLEHHGAAAGIRHIAVAPLHQADQHRLQIHPFASQVVFEAWRVRLVLALLDQTVLDQSLQPRSKNIARDAEVIVYLIEAVRTQKELAQHEHTPGVAEDV